MSEKMNVDIKFLTILLMVIIFSQKTANAKVMESPQKTNDSLKHYQFILKYLKDKPLKIIAGKARDLNIIQIINLQFPKILIIGKENLEKNLSKCDCNYIFIEINLKTLKSTLKAAKSFKTDNKFLVIFKNQLQVEETKKTFLTLWQHQIYNTVVANFDEILTWYPYSAQNHCGQSANLELVKTSDPYKGKIPPNLNGCQILGTWSSLAILQNKSYKFVDPIAHKKTLDTAAQYLNASVSYLRLEDDSLGNSMKQSDLCLYASQHYGPIGEFQPTYTITQSNYYIVLPPRAKIIYKNLYYNMFQPTVACIFFGILAITSVLWKILTQNSWTESILNVFHLSIIMVTLLKPNGFKVKLFLIFFLGYIMLVNTVYQTQLSSILTKPRYSRKIETFQEFFETGLKIKAFQSLEKWVTSREDDVARELIRRRVDPGDITVVDYFLQFLANPDTAITITDAHFSMFNNPQNFEVMFKEKVTTIYLQLLAKKGYPLFDKINYWILNIKEKGLVEKWKKEEVQRFKKVLVDFNREFDKEKLGFPHLSGAFYLLSLGLTLSFITFAIELRI